MAAIWQLAEEAGLLRELLEIRFWGKVSKRGPFQPHMKTRCWVWTGASTRGYGAMGRGPSQKGKVYYAHRVAFFLAEGRWPEPEALHDCDYTLCVRRSHLIEGSHHDNMIDSAKKGRMNRGEKNANAKLTAEDVFEMKRLREEGWTGEELAEKFQVRRNTIYRNTNGSRWSHLRVVK